MSTALHLAPLHTLGETGTFEEALAEQPGREHQAACLGLGSIQEVDGIGGRAGRSGSHLGVVTCSVS